MPADVILVGLGQIVLTAFAKEVITELSEKSVPALIHWLEQNKRPLRLSADRIGRFRSLLEADRSFLSAFRAQLKKTDRRGIMFVGPSGAGKSAIVNFLKTGTPTLSTESTPRLITKNRRFGTRIAIMRDTPGGDHKAFREEVHATLLANAPRILVLVVANGFLHTAGNPALKRPGMANPVPSLSKYRAICLEEEIEYLTWLNAISPPQRRIPYFLTLVNKLELWDDDISIVLKQYKSNGHGKLMRALIKSWGTPNAHHGIATTSASYDVFPGSNRAPSAQVGVSGSELSITMLRGLLLDWMADDH